MRGERRYRESMRREQVFQERMEEFRKQYGLVNLESTGPATWEEIEQARGALGEPKTHEEWLEACKLAREKHHAG